MASPLCLKNTFLELAGQTHWDAEFAEGDTGFKRQCSDGALWVRSNVQLWSHSEGHSEAPTGSDVMSDPETCSTPPTPLAETDETSSSNDGAHASVPTPHEVAAKGGGLSGLTTAMLRNVPPGYSQHGLMTELNRSGFVGSFDFFYLPSALRLRRNRGFAFINFLEPELAEKFYGRYQGRFLRNFKEPTTEPLLILPADVQGFEASALAAANVTRQQWSAPVLLRAMPHAAEEAPSREELARRAKGLELKPQHRTADKAQMQRDVASDQTPSASVPSCSMQFCTGCGGELPGYCRFCPYCGSQLALRGINT